MARVLVTGATGFIGRHLVRRLVERGDQVRCLVRNPDRLRAMPIDSPLPSDVEYVRGDVTVRDSLEEAVSGVETVYHLAGATLAIHPCTYRLVNARGTRWLAEACAGRSVPPTFVYISSLAAAGPSRYRPLSEDYPPRPVSDYGRSKLDGERSLRSLAGRLPITVLRPPCVFGPGEPYLLKLLRLARRGIVLHPGLDKSRHSWIYVEDLVEAMVLAAERGRRLVPYADPLRDESGVYFVALDERPTVTELANLMAEAVGSRISWSIRVPLPLCWLGAYINDYRARPVGRAYWLNSDKLREILAGSWICDPSKAKHELGFVCRNDLATGLRATARWYHDRGWL